MLNGYIAFPHAAQVFRIERHRADLSGNLKSKEVVYGVTSLSPEKADAERLLALSRGHWEIENRLHWVRDVTFDEDRSQIRTKAGPRMFATLRNFAIGVLRLSGCNNIAAGLRNLSWGGARQALTLIGC